MRFGQRQRDHNALAGGQTIGLDDDRSTFAIDVVVRCHSIGKGAVCCRRNVVPRHEGLRKVLRAFQLGSRCSGPKNAQST